MTTSKELVTQAQAASATKPPVGLLLSIGAPKPESGPGRPIDWIRPKEGQLEQYAEAVARYHDVYGEQPKQLDDIFFLSNKIADVLDIRLMAWGASKARVRGETNFALLGKDDWQRAAYAFDDEVLFYPRSAREVPKELRDSWNGEPIRDRLTGPNDPRIETLGISVECTLTFCLPKVMGFGTVAQITTKGRRSTRNLVSSVWDQWTFFQQQLIAVPFRLTVRPARGDYFDAAKREYRATRFFELVLDTPFTVQEAIDAIRERRLALTSGQPGPGSPEALQLTRALQLPVGETAGDEVVQLRDEPSASHLDDALLNRIAGLEQKVGVESANVTLRGVFGVDDARELSQEDAERYEQVLARAAESIEDAGEPEIIGDEDIEFGAPRR